MPHRGSHRPTGAYMGTRWRTRSRAPERGVGEALPGPRRAARSRHGSPRINSTVGRTVVAGGIDVADYRLDGDRLEAEVAFGNPFQRGRNHITEHQQRQCVLSFRGQGRSDARPGRATALASKRCGLAVVGEADSVAAVRSRHPTASSRPATAAEPIRAAASTAPTERPRLLPPWRVLLHVKNRATRALTWAVHFLGLAGAGSRARSRKRTLGASFCSSKSAMPSRPCPVSHDAPDGHARGPRPDCGLRLLGGGGGDRSLIRDRLPGVEHR
jgi:hypothetical protein